VNSKDSIYFGSENASDWVLVGSVEDTPTNGATDIGISSNWAYDHELDPNAHSTVVDTPSDGDTTHAISSNWAYDHNISLTAHNGSTETDENSYAVRYTGGRLKVASGALPFDAINWSQHSQHLLKTDAHEASSSRTDVSRIMLRDSNGRSEVEDPSSFFDIANKRYVDFYNITDAPDDIISVISKSNFERGSPCQIRHW